MALFLMESLPYLICLYVIGAKVGHIYCKTEYPIVLKRLKSAIIQLNMAYWGPWDVSFTIIIAAP